MASNDEVTVALLFSKSLCQENLKQLQAQHPERKTKGHYDSMAYFEAGRGRAREGVVRVGRNAFRRGAALLGGAGDRAPDSAGDPGALKSTLLRMC